MLNYTTLLIIFVPFIGTSLGSAMVYLLRRTNQKLSNLLNGFASGVMIAASVWSLLIPSIEMAKSQGKIAWFPAACGFMLGIVFLLLLDMYIPHLHFLKSDSPEGVRAPLQKSTMMMLAVTLHNIPEGMAIGISLAAALERNIGISMASALALSIGIAIQNFPEGAIISLPLKNENFSSHHSFLWGVLSGVVEPIASIITLLLTKQIIPLMPYLLAFAAGAMIYVVVEELIPESREGVHSNLATIGVAIGFVIMMILDVALS